MAAVERSSTSNYLSYLNPLNIPSYLYRVVSQIFARSTSPDNGFVIISDIKPEGPATRAVVIRGYDDDEKDDGYVWTGGYTEFLNRSSNPYPTAEFKLSDGSTLKVAKTWLSDIERLGEPDEFFINGDKIEKAPKTEAEKEEVLKKLKSVLVDDEDYVRDWTELWSYRPKVALMNELMMSFKEKYQLNPLFGRNGFKKVTISLDTNKGFLTCHVSGSIENGTDDNSDIVPIKVEYEADMTYNFEQEEVAHTIGYRNL